ncbi:MAG: leucine-rich repeat protein, partial [Bacteroidetes bacterium]|nr:leucine-rich repeat protein [Bacteroidota bacterium]
KQCSGNYYTGGILTTKRVVVLIHILIMCAFATSNLIAQSCPTTNTTISYQEFMSPLCPAEINIVCPLVTSIVSGAFNGCTSLESVSFPLVSGIIGDGAFIGCSNLENIYFPLAVTIGTSVFNSCISLKSADFPLAETIGISAFQNCTSLESVDFPLAESIGDNAFRNCTNLNSIKLGAVPPTLGTIVFGDVTLSNITLHIPAGSRGAYESHSDWSGFFSPTLLFAAVEEYCDPATPSLSVITSGSGSVVTSPLATANLPCSTVVSLTATAGACYQFDGWTNADNTVLSTNATETIAVIKDSTITANFTPITTTYTLSLDDDGNGSASVSGGSATGITCGASRIITATANACYEFAKWTNSNGDSISNVSPLSITLYKDTVIKANFKLISPEPTYTLSVSSNPTMGTASSFVSSATCGSSVTVTATPNVGYKFVRWQEGLAVVSSANPHTFNIGANRTLTAIFDDAKKKTRIKKINVKKGRLIITPQP